MYKIGVIGDKDSILGFKALGLSVFPVTTSEEGSKILHQIISQDNYAVIYITEQIASGMAESIEKYKDLQLPAIIPIPGNQGSLGIGISSVKKAVERAVGADILFNN